MATASMVSLRTRIDSGKQQERLREKFIKVPCNIILPATFKKDSQMKTVFFGGISGV
jgi:hypothetical protein